MAEKEKKQKKKSLKIKKADLFSVEGDTIKRKKKSCPKCGSGVFLAQHKDRVTCGKCSFTEWTKGEAK